MIKHIWTSAAVLGTMVALPTVADARPPYLEAVEDGTEAAVAEPACELAGMTCGLCHEPSEGDRLENVRVGGGGINAATRNGPFFESLTGAGGWNPMPGSVGPNASMLLEMVIPTMVDDNVDSDGDGVGDIEELALGYNPLLAYDETDEALSQLCPDAMPFPDVGGSSTTGDGTTGDEGTSGDPDPTTSGGDATTGGPTDPDTGDDEASAEGTPPPPGEGGSADGTGSGTGGSTGSSTGGSNDEDGGCRIGGSGHHAGALGLLVLLGLRSSRRRRR